MFGSLFDNVSTANDPLRTMCHSGFKTLPLKRGPKDAREVGWFRGRRTKSLMVLSGVFQARKWPEIPLCQRGALPPSSRRSGPSATSAQPMG